AGYTATESSNTVEAAEGAYHSLKQRKELAALPVSVIGASMGTAAACGLFAAEKEIRALVLMVPGNPDIFCPAFKKIEGRPLFLIQAEQDEVVGAQTAEKIKVCLPSQAKYSLLKGSGHRFPPSAVIEKILEFLNQRGTASAGTSHK